MGISEVAERTGFPVTTLRYYEAIGLVPPPSRSDGGSRQYDEHHLETLGFIDEAKGLGLSLTGIAEVLDLWRGGKCSAARERMAALLRQRFSEVSRRLEELDYQRSQLAEASRRILDQSAPLDCTSECDCSRPLSALGLGARGHELDAL